LKVLHLSDSSLPDWRIEKSAITAKREGYDVFFAGEQNKHNYKNSIFNKIYQIHWNFRAKYKFPFFYQILKKKINNVIQEIRPDVIHAHNIFPAKIASESDIPFVFDDHEYSSMHGKVIYESFKIRQSLDKSKKNKIRWIARKSLKRYMSNLWTEWEKEIVSKYPTITVSEKIAEELKKYSNGNKIFIVPNVPMKNEISNLASPDYHTELSSVYMGSDGLATFPYPNRDISGLVEIFNNNEIGSLDIIGWNDKKNENSKIRFHGYVSRDNIFKLLTKSSIGLVPWKKHWSHYYVNPNKTYEYVHAGLLVMCTSDLTTISSLLKGNCILFDDYNDLVQKLKYFSNNIEELNKLRIKSFNFAKENLIWEKYDHNIINVYKSLS
jgi:glycosyltransferase involved in cell wall biosynthesis